MNIKLSIIVPVYNVENYIDECMHSIFLQECEECEVILVDDGSTDSSPSICDSYKENNHVKVVHQKNKGLSGARNTGLNYANGRYIAFLDSDDRLAPNSLSRLIKLLEKEKTDFIFMEGIKFFENGHVEPLGDQIEKEKLYNINKKAAIEHICSRPKFPGSACTKIYSLDFLKRNNIRFPDDRRYSEDLGFVLRCILKANTYNAAEFPYYEYRQGRQGSITSTFNAKSFWDLSLFVRESIELLTIDKKPIGDNEKECLSIIAYEFSVMLLYYEALDYIDKIRAKEFIKNFKWIFKFSKSKKVYLIGVLLKVFKTDITVTILNFYMNKRR